MRLGSIALKLRGNSCSNLLRWASTADLAPVRKRVETRGKGKLLLVGAVRIDQKELELTASPHTPVEHNLLPVGRPRGRQVADRVFGQLHLSGANRVHDANLEVGTAPPATEDNARTVRGPRRGSLLLGVVGQARRLTRPVRVDHVNLSGDMIVGIVADGVACEHDLLSTG